MIQKTTDNIKGNTIFLDLVVTDSTEAKLEHVQTAFSLNNLMILRNLICISNEGFLVDLATQLVSYFCDLTFLQTNIMQNKSDNELKIELFSNKAGNA